MNDYHGRRRNITTTPLIEALAAEVIKHKRGWNGKQMTFAQAIQWMLEDFTWCEPDKPAYGRWSPVMAGCIRDALANLAAKDAEL